MGKTAITDVLKLEVERSEDGRVILTLRCRDAYASMMLYDKIVAEITSGRVSIEFTTRSQPPSMSRT